MATTTSPDNILVLEMGDNDTPSSWQPAMATSVQNALLSRALKTYKWANATERGAEVGMGEGDLGFQMDTGVTYQYDTTEGWERVLPIVSPIIQSGTLTTASTLQIDGLTGFREYEITLDLPTSSTANQMTAQLRSGGVANTSANYDTQRAGATTTTPVATEALGATSWTLGNGNRVEHTHILRLISLNSASRTVLENRFTAWDSTSNGQSYIVAHRHRSSAAFDGIEFATNTGTVSGTYVVRGIE